jgi:DNA-directed RNA polymerase subunit RPC12/RpoP
MAPIGKCVKCGKIRYGWALLSKPKERKCPDCGGEIVIDVQLLPEGGDA